MCFAVCIPVSAVPIELLPLQNEPALAGDTDTAYEYPVIHETKEWVDLGSTNARHMACEIPSKWGRAPLTEHPVMECPYAALSVSCYRLYTK